MRGNVHHGATSFHRLAATMFLVIGLVTVGCSGAGSSVSPSSPAASSEAPSISPSLPAASEAPTSGASPNAAEFETFAVAMCNAFDSMFNAVGNPDTGEGSEISDALEAAADARDVATAEQLASQVMAELEKGRAHAATAAEWAPGAAMAGQMNRFLLAYEAWTTAQVEAAQRGLGIAHPQEAFEKAGGVDAWQAMFTALQAMAADRPPVPPHECPTVPVSF